MSILGTIDAPLDMFGGLVTDVAAADVPAGASPDCADVAFVPGAAFHATGGGDNTMRLNFSYSAPDTIREGITRLGVTLKELIAQNGHH